MESTAWVVLLIEAVTTLALGAALDGIGRVVVEVVVESKGVIVDEVKGVEDTGVGLESKGMVSEGSGVIVEGLVVEARVVEGLVERGCSGVHANEPDVKGVLQPLGIIPALSTLQCYSSPIQLLILGNFNPSLH